MLGREPWRLSAKALSRSVVRYVGSIGIVAVTSGVAEIVYRLTGETRLAMVFLAGVMVAAVTLGSGPGFLAATLAFLIYNFYLVDPRFSFTFDTAEDAVTVIVFLAAALLTGALAGRVRDEAERAKSRAAMTNALFDASREFSATSDEKAIRQQLAKRLGAAARGQAFIRDGLNDFTQPLELELTPETVGAANAVDADAEAGSGVASRSAGPWTLRPLRVGEASLGVAGWRPERPLSIRPEELALIEILLEAGAAAISRARLAAAKADIETQARTEELRNILLSSISHDVRTPLAAIMASAGSLRRYGGALDEATRLDLASTIEEEAGRLDAFVSNLLSLTRLEAGALVVQRIGFSVPEVIDRIVARRGAGQRTITVHAASGLPEGAGDPLLFEQVFGNVLENAIRFSGESQPIVISASLQDEHVLVRVEDEGPGVPASDLTRIFDKFFRSAGAANRSGTGLGLAIAKGLIEGMGGAIWADNREGPGGLRVNMRLTVMR